MHEQTGIVEYVTHRIISIGVAQESIVQKITLLREYRTRLIADIVTGKLDVRDTAAGLPTVNTLGADDDVEAFGVDATSESEGFGTAVEEVEA